MPQLDSLRALAIAAVVHHHWRINPPELPLVSGVHLFFVLSGFLITGILLDARKLNAGSGGAALRYTLRGFYARRFLRIFPLYYAALAIATYFDVAGLRHTFLWHATYLSNFHIFLRNDWIGLVGHFWTLAVEEQFYLVWPIVVLCFPTAWLRRTFLAVAAGSVLFRFIGAVWFPRFGMWNLTTPGYLDCFALGALVAHERRAQSALYSTLARLRAPMIVACWLLSVLRRKTPADWHLVFLDPFFLAVAYASLVSMAADRVRGPIGWLLNRPGLQYLGTISYGLYVIHNFAPIPIQAFLRRFPGLLVVPKIQLMLMALWTLGLAMLSWHLFEAPINGLKKHFPYVSRTKPAQDFPADLEKTAVAGREP
jgi:peptidoglycan/LPS O-acetylase OafA/YrhL